MAALHGGVIPPFYREVYEIVCPDGDTKIPKNLCVRLMLQSKLPKDVLAEIWKAVDPKGLGCLNRDSLYKALALIALAQQSKPPTDKSLEIYTDSGITACAVFCFENTCTYNMFVIFMVIKCKKIYWLESDMYLIVATHTVSLLCY
jgi:hypothetical protein